LRPSGSHIRQRFESAAVGSATRHPSSARSHAIQEEVDDSPSSPLQRFRIVGDAVEGEARGVPEQKIKEQHGFLTGWSAAGAPPDRASQDAQERTRRVAQRVTRREHFYGEFIEEASRLFTDALTHELDDPSKFVRLYAMVGRLRLLAPANVIASAEQVMQHIVETYYLPNRDFSNPEEKPREDIDMLRAFSEACRQDLGV
jgi:hypothetical protein